MSKKSSVLLILSVFLVLSTSVFAQNVSENPFQYLEIDISPKQSVENKQSWQIKDFEFFGRSSGISFTDDSLFRTDDNGANWREIVLPKKSFEKISAVSFIDENIGWTMLADTRNFRLELLKTSDGGNSWIRNAVNLRKEDLEEASLDNVLLENFDTQTAEVKIRLQSSSNFLRQAVYSTKNGGQTWEFEQNFDKIKTSDNDIEPKKSAWQIIQEGNCEGFKTGCVQETKLYGNGKEITPPQIKMLTQIEKSKAKLEAKNSIFALAPDGAVRTSLNRGFDKCTAASVSQMQTWWNNSPFYDANIYISGRNRGCSQSQLTASWVNQISTMGWGLIPTIVGYQSPCSVCASCAKHSYDTATAETQGRGEADIAINDANNLGLTQGTVLYYDMERYDETGTTPGCRVATVAFLKGWTNRVKERGYVSGTYGSPTNAVADWINMSDVDRMDAIWMARWDNNPSVWTYASPSPAIPTNVWSNRRRIKQYQAPHDETWGGVLFNIDGNKAEGPVAGILAAKNKAADFDGDGKSDVSVYRPDIGAWYILNSSNSSFTAFNFGAAEDILVPGDYDGNGKTDYAVFRPSTGSWYIQNRIFRAQQFGIAGDIPVPADYNGDGFTDIAVYRPSTGSWYISNSSGAVTFRAELFGTDGDKPAPGDYDGDGKADIAVYRPSTGNWYILASTQGFIATQFGISSDKPAPGDYDGDGKADIAVYRDGNWYLMQSQNGFTATQFGAPTDRTIPSAYVPQN